MESTQLLVSQIGPQNMQKVWIIEFAPSNGRAIILTHKAAALDGRLCKALPNGVTSISCQMPGWFKGSYCFENWVNNFRI